MAWLAEYIKSLKNTTVMVVSHDADFMELVVTDVIHIHDLKLTYYADGFINFRRNNPAMFPEDEQPVHPPAEGEETAVEEGTGKGPSHPVDSLLTLPIKRSERGARPKVEGQRTHMRDDTDRERSLPSRANSLCWFVILWAVDC